VPITAAMSPSILVAEDDPELLATLEIILTTKGYRVVRAVDGVDAVEKFKAEPFDVLLTDLAMPRLNGVQLARICKRLKPTVPIVMLTAWGVLVSDDDRDTAGIDVVLTKPVRVADIVKSISGLGVAH
jgi:two-component system cell cycle response regulator CpdR